MKMDAKSIAQRLELYEQKAYEGRYGVDWLGDIGENLKFYMLECAENDVQPTMEGFIKRVDQMHEKAEQ